MKSASIAFREQLYADNRNYLIKYVITLKSGTVLTVENDKVWNKGFSYTRAVSESGSFTIGAAVIGKLTAIISNIYHDFDQYDFSGAKVTAFIGLKLNDGTKEYLNYGKFTVDDPKTTQTIISLTCYDNISLLDKKYVCHVSFPCTRLELLQDACTQCGVMLNTVSFNGYSESVEQFDTSTITCREIVSYVSQMGCLFAYADEAGSINLKWYDTTAASTVLDGGTFAFNDGVVADGGTFNFNDGYNADGGTFTQNFAVIGSHSHNPTISVDDVVITGIRITSSTKYGDTSGSDLITHLSGEEGYVLEITNNPFITNDNVIAVADYIYGKIAGLSFRPFSSSSLSDPCIEPGDAAYLVFKDNTAYKTFITSMTLTTGSYESFSCDAESPGKNTSYQYSASTKTAAAAKQETDNTVTAYSLAMQRLTTLMANSFGAYQTEQIQPDGSIIYYMHNKPTLAASTKIWKRTIDAFAVSTDGGKTWNAGVDSSGNIVANILSAIGINADWVNAGSIIIGGSQVNRDGTIKIYDTNGKQIFNISKSGMIVDLPTFKMDLAGNMTLTGNAKVYGGIYAAKDLYIGVWDPNNEDVNNVTMRSILNVSATGDWTSVTTQLKSFNQTVLISHTINDLGQWMSINPSNIPFAIGNLINYDGSVLSMKPFSVGAEGDEGGQITFLHGSNATIDCAIDLTGNVFRLIDNSGGNWHEAFRYNLQNHKWEGDLKCTGNVSPDTYYQIPAASYNLTHSNAPNVVWVGADGYMRRSTSSSRAYKHDIIDLDIEDINALYSLPVRSFKYNEDYMDKDDYRYMKDIPGFIVEELEEIFPISVDLKEDGTPEMWSYKIIVPSLLKLVQDLNDREISLKKRVEELENKMQLLIEKVGGVDVY